MRLARYLNSGGAARAGALLLAALSLAGCADLGFINPAGPVAAAQRDHLWSILWWMMPVVVPLFVLLPLILWRYRYRGAGDYRPDWTHSNQFEVLIWGLPVIIVGVLGYNLWVETVEMDPYKPLPGGEPMQIQVIGYDWKWLFLYPEQGVSTVNALYLPVNRPVEFELTSASVLQSFLIPKLGGQIYAMPGMITKQNLKGDVAGDYIGLNTQYNGNNFTDQHFDVHVVPEASFDAWVTHVKDSGAPALDEKMLAALQVPSVPEAPDLFSTAPDGAFEGVVEQAMVKGTCGI
ncbi:cytochrome c oxidase subunit II [Rhodalgimonas zhirmunskyi]|uniref:Cytochrome ubiquinol oxidase subunit II n=1 Tax=Rhodalgimonas zhirmunskyi TaxID=2964767 RepID=A0AAJ1U9B8_9RHOB|nr:cytochrome ubiquinol oxidase subunit II [Rhodoalgimonas zhirmunskyi]MDQ2093648.1 cytochrome ubiquinol oxidase subunit II [Rhodoalgimonas zhirmunskyi]